jgi:hypothetical protein
MVTPAPPTDPAGTIAADGTIDPAAGVVVVCVGKKGSGKSVMGLRYCRAFPGDRLIIDVAGDDGPVGEDVWEMRGRADELPLRWPELPRDGDRPMTIRYVPDAGSPTFLADVDTALGIALNRPVAVAPDLPCMVLVHEMGRVFPAGRPLPNAQRLLQHGRHNGATTLVACGPRSQGIDRLLLQQADLIYVFELQGKDDRDTIADNIGWDKKAFDAAVGRLQRYEHLLYDSNIPAPLDGQPDTRLRHLGALPAKEVESVLRWADGWRPKRTEAYADARP